MKLTLYLVRDHKLIQPGNDSLLKPFPFDDSAAQRRGTGANGDQFQLAERFSFRLLFARMTENRHEAQIAAPLAKQIE